MSAEFDHLGARYQELLKDPLRDYFGSGAESEFFVTRKLDVLLAFAKSLRFDTSRATWLDVGCGQGQFLRLGRQHFARILGCDVSIGMMQHCQDLEVATQVEADRLPFQDASADWITAVCTYHHVEPRSWASLTADITRVLRPGGVFMMVEHNPLNPAVRIIVRRTPVDAHAVLLTAGTARRLMVGAGLRVAGTNYFLYVPQRLYRWGRFLEKALVHVCMGGQYAVFGVKPGGAGPGPDSPTPGRVPIARGDAPA